MQSPRRGTPSSPSCVAGSPPGPSARSASRLRARRSHKDRADRSSASSCAARSPKSRPVAKTGPATEPRRAVGPPDRPRGARPPPDGSSSPVTAWTFRSESNRAGGDDVVYDHPCVLDHGPVHRRLTVRLAASSQRRGPSVPPACSRRIALAPLAVGSCSHFSRILAILFSTRPYFSILSCLSLGS